MELKGIKNNKWLLFKDKNNRIIYKTNLVKKETVKWYSSNCQQISTNYKLNAVSKFLR